MRTALFNWLLARRDGGRFVLRIEDTDAERSRDGFSAGLLEDLRWLGLDWDEGPVVGGPSGPYEQSARTALYADGFARLEARALVYDCYCSTTALEVSRRAQIAAGQAPRYAGTCRALTAAQRAAHAAAGRRPTLRFHVPADRSIAFDDLVHGPQVFRSDDIGDFVVRRADGSAAFFFSNALDDGAMGITHVLRGEDHLSNTPRQLLILRALGLAAPRYGHVALLTGADGVPLSKRHGSTSVRDYRAQGYAPEALCNHLFRLGHSTSEHGLLGPAAMARCFDPAHLQRAPARFDPVQLTHWQSLWVRSLSPAQAAAWLGQGALGSVPGERRDAFLAAVLPNVTLAEDARVWADLLFADAVTLEPEAARAIAAAGPAFFARAAAAVGAGTDVAALRAATGARGVALFAPLRAALTGRLHGPDFGALLALLPAETVRARLLKYAGED